MQSTLLQDAIPALCRMRCRYHGTSQEYTAFSKKMNLPQQRERVTVDGPGNIGVGKWKLSGDKAAAPLPRGYKDCRNAGEKITADELDSFVKKAESLNVGFGTGKAGTFAGFEGYRGDTKVLDEVLEHVKLNQPVLTKLSGNDKITLKYMNLLDDAGRVDTETFAMTKGRTIYLNKFMFDDSKFLAEEYSKSVNEHFFVKGTDYRNIVDHEFGHIFARHDKRYISALNRVCESRARAQGITMGEYIVRFISEYANWGVELPAEINSMLHGSDNKIAKDLLKEAGLL